MTEVINIRKIVNNDLFINLIIGNIMDEFDYKLEFLTYLKQYDINKKILDIEKSEYSEFHKELIRVVDSQVDTLIGLMSQARGINPSIHVYCIDDSSVNAFCFVTNKHYYIGINAGAYIELIDRTQVLAEKIITKEYLNNINSVTELHAVLWNYAFKMILSHEYMHIILGHCDWSCEKKAFLWENSVENNIEDYLERQALEMLADEFACMDLINQAMCFSNHSIDIIKDNVLLYYLSILLTFSLFETDTENRMTDHPHLSVRWHYIASVVDDKLYDLFSGESRDPFESLEDVNEVIDDYMQLIRNLPDIFRYDIVTQLSMAEVDKEYINIYNTAADLLIQTNMQALYPIDEIEKKSEAMWEKTFCAENEFIELFQQGKTYEQASELIVKKYGIGIRTTKDKEE